ncbi:hypothetical protein EYV94_27725 [Puteibacter caeruleilacunae]|nr:hypothetical protein EYV94_27725 [Puteibacter caeruleilacunae]
MDQLGDHNAMYRHGGNSTNPLTRYYTGYEQGMLDAEIILKQITDENGNPKETIKIITHSMGGAYGKGYVKALKAYIAKKGYKNVLITLVADFDPFQASALEAEDNVYTQQYTHKKKWDSLLWWLANQIQDGISDDDYHEDEKQGDHSIMTFFNDISNLQEGNYVWNGSYKNNKYEKTYYIYYNTLSSYESATETFTF